MKRTDRLAALPGQAQEEIPGFVKRVLRIKLDIGSEV